jgi:chromate transport protein ChrA
LPTAIASFGLALGIAQVNEQLPDPVYALLSGLNAATVGIIALAAVQLSQKAITDKVSRCLVFWGACAGMLYNTLWYFPVLMVVGSITTIVWDYKWPQKVIKMLKPARRTERTLSPDVEASDNATELAETAQPDVRERRSQTSLSQPSEDTTTALRNTSTGARTNGNENDPISRDDSQERTVPEALKMRVFSWKFGTAIIALFFITFAAIMVLRGVLPDRPRGFSLFANLYLAGTIIFGGGPVVIPLLRESVTHIPNAFLTNQQSLTDHFLPDTLLLKAGSPRVTSS